MKSYLNLMVGSMLLIAIASLGSGNHSWWIIVALLSAAWICLSYHHDVARRDWALSRIGLECRGDSIYIRHSDDEVLYYDIHELKKLRTISRSARRASCQK